VTRRVLCAAAALSVLLGALIAQQSWRPVLAFEAATDPHRPPLRLADTGLYADASSAQIASTSRAFMPQYPLWTDGMTKKRWIFLPPGTAIDGRDEANWNFPVGTKLWKEFSTGGRPVETRMLWKAGEGRWVFATYEWNAAGTDAVLAPDDGRLTDVELAPTRRHGIPSRSDCTACHGTREPRPLGFTALQLSTDRDPNSLHGEPLQPGMLTLGTLVESGQLRHGRPDLVSDPPRIRTSDPLTRTVLGYLSANCGMCHNGNGEIAAIAPVIRYRDLVTDAEAVARRLEGQPTRWQRPGVTEGTLLVRPGVPEESALFLRMRSRSPSSQMPPLGTVVRDEEAIERVREWIGRRNP
jgi:hypothetical protein